MSKLKIMIVLSVFVFISALQAQKLIIMTEIFPPYQFKDKNGKLIGIAVDIVKAIQKKIGDKNKIKVYPWARANKILDLKKNAVLFSMMRTPQRETLYKWVGPIDRMELVFFKKKGSKITLKSIEDAKKVAKIGVTKNVANCEILKNRGFKNLDILIGNDYKNIYKLIKGRIDLWPSIKAAGLYYAKNLKKKNQIEIIPHIYLAEGDLYIAFNKNADEKIIKKWQIAFNELLNDGTINKIKKRYR
jgi:polar amino acid transport system substrate-binding protein